MTPPAQVDWKWLKGYWSERKTWLEWELAEFLRKCEADARARLRGQV